MLFRHSGRILMSDYALWLSLGGSEAMLERFRHE